MNKQQHTNYFYIAEIIEHLKAYTSKHPSLEEIAEKCGISPSRVQHVFSEWANTNLEDFSQYTSLQYTKKLVNKAVNKSQPTLFEALEEAQTLPFDVRHNALITIQEMTSEEYTDNAAKLAINYAFSESIFGKLILAATPKGVCYIAFIEDEKNGFQALQHHFPHATFTQKESDFQHDALRFFSRDWTALNPLKLHLKGTPFQLKTWKALLEIPFGQLTTYGDLAANLATLKAARAIGTAIGKNPITFLIPCHRVVQSSGELGGYMWGTTRKAAIIAWEAAAIYTNKDTSN